MELIFYPEASTITGATVGSVAHAVSRGDLTRAGRNGRKLCLIREQVELFRGRHISYDALTEKDKAIWQRCAQEGARLMGATTINEEAINRMIEQKVKAQFVQQEVARLKQEEDRAREKRERFEEEYRPFLMAV